MQDSSRVKELQDKLDIALRVIAEMKNASPSSTGKPTPSPATKTSSGTPSSVSGKGTPASASGKGTPAAAKATPKSLAKGKGKAEAEADDAPSDVSRYQSRAFVGGKFKPCRPCPKICHR